MIVKKIISKSKDGNRMEVIAKEDKVLKTLHIHKENNIWRYFAGYDKKDTKIYLPIAI
jgi:hypothetical protein